MSIVVTGAAGFIGSCLVRMLNDRGIRDVYLVDDIGESAKWKHFVNKEYIDYFHKDEFLGILPELKGLTHIIHMGACSSTTERDFDYLYRNNFDYTRKLWQYCVENNISFIYASSAATYGDGKEGFDDEDDIHRLRPLNGYGYSKHLFDLWAEKQTKVPKQHVGLKFFNVYGPNEDCKDDMASVIFKSFNQINEVGRVKLFRSHNPDYKDGGQLRDFVYVKDICKVISFLIDHPDISGLFNLGTGKARSFKDLAEATFHAMGVTPNIEYIDMPISIRDKYQYFTEAKMDKLRNAGYTEGFYSLEDGVEDYVKNYLIPNQVC